MLMSQSFRTSLLNDLKALNLENNESKRMNCSFCNGVNSFSVRSIDRFINYYCFRASCGIKGRDKKDITLESIQKSKEDKLKDLWTLTDYFTNPLQSERALGFIRYYQLLEPYKNKEIELYYDIKQERLIFPLRSYEKELKGAVGRTIRNGLPKWYVYNRDESCPYICYKGDKHHVILVEDAISAIRASI